MLARSPRAFPSICQGQCVTFGQIFKSLGLRGFPINTSESRLINAADCPPYFTEFLNDLAETIGMIHPEDEDRNNEVKNFTSGKVDLRLDQLLSYLERLLLVMQKMNMDGERQTVELLQKGGVAAIQAEIDRDIAAGHLPSWAFFDLAAWEGAAEDSEYGRLLNIQDFPDSARSFLENRIGESEFQIDPEREGLPNYELYLFMESHKYLEPGEVMNHITRLLQEYIS
jgi:hypothetical protein